ncbi:RNA-processing protein [Candidatus Woesearchaeota archaeon]|nr:MAG: ribosomal RNA assembly protein [archaeon GW2011_AR4]MBS3129040.1 RNA-processing protein [Candidatus Woesearchaeota archaeon]HIH37774.1 RNA-processing protein [Candidatus Woesearchaeota archaeon]HIH49543.1 RNA-processing protein [Candidatus Woesearchaeota archaeon]HIJ03899.1 RNA-processing protein [Candidatus Woesearchaeota archaeon]
MLEFNYELKVPKERIPILIGSGGEIKKQIEEATETSLKISSEEGEVSISGRDNLKLYTAREIVRSIGRGFNPDIALLLLKSDYSCETISIGDFVKTKQHLQRLKGRVIGEEGKARKYIEELTSTHISVYGKTISIIGEVQDVMNARKAIDQLLTGSMHKTVYRFLEQKRTEKRKAKTFV